MHSNATLQEDATRITQPKLSLSDLNNHMLYRITNFLNFNDTQNLETALGRSILTDAELKLKPLISTLQDKQYIMKHAPELLEVRLKDPDAEIVRQVPMLFEFDILFGSPRYLDHVPFQACAKIDQSHIEPYLRHLASLDVGTWDETNINPNRQGHTERGVLGLGEARQITLEKQAEVASSFFKQFCENAQDILEWSREQAQTDEQRQTTPDAEQFAYHP